MNSSQYKPLEVMKLQPLLMHLLLAAAGFLCVRWVPTM
jgi:hypothetical protein